MILKYILFVFIISCLNGCVSFNSNHNNRNEEWGGYKYDREYRLISDVFLLKVDTDIGDELMGLSPENNLPVQAGYYNAPKSVKEYLKTNGNVEYADDVIDVIYSGTIIKTILLENTKSLSLWFGYLNGNNIKAMVQDGKHKGIVVDIHDISAFCKDGKIEEIIKFKPDPRLLVPVNDVDIVNCNTVINNNSK